MSEGSVSRRQDESGAIAVMAVVLLAAMIVATSLAVDVGRAAYVSRDQQGVTDRAALDGMDAVDGDEVSLSVLHDEVTAAVAESLGRNLGTSTGTAENREVEYLELGIVQDDEFRVICSDDAGRPAATPSCAAAEVDFDVVDVTAIKLETYSYVPFVFALGDAQGGRDVFKTAIAESLALGSVSVGSELAGVGDGLLEDTLNGLICEAILNAGESSCNLAVSAGGYRGLVDAEVTLGDLLDELALVAAAPDGVLSADVTALEFVTAVANVLDANGMGDHATVLRDIAVELPTDQLELQVLDLIDLATTSPGMAADVGLNVLDLLRGGIQVANGDNLLTLPDLSVAIPGVADVDGALTVIEAPRTAIGPVGDGNRTVARTSQVRATLDPEVTLDVLTPISAALAGLSLGTINTSVSPVNLPLGVDVAGATARLTGVDCNPNLAEPDALTQTSTNVARVLVGDFDTVTGALSPADLLTVNVTLRVLGIPVLRLDVDVDIEAELPIGGATGAEHRFDAAQFTGQDPDTGQLTYPRGPSQLGGTLIESGDLNATNIDLTVTGTNVQVLGVLPLPIGTLLNQVVNAVEGTVLTAILPVVTDLVEEVVDPLFETLGVGVGNADTWANWAHCEGRRLRGLNLTSTLATP